VFIFQALTALLSDDSKFGFIVIDGSGALFGTLQGNTREVLHKFTVDLPKKHGNIGREHEPFYFVISRKVPLCRQIAVCAKHLLKGMRIFFFLTWSFLR
jgi:peptide subunit release factor 1 (eRF1)